MKQASAAEREAQSDMFDMGVIAATQKRGVHAFFLVRTPRREDWHWACDYCGVKMSEAANNPMCKVEQLPRALKRR